jgi:hypothetical protein
LDEPEIDEREPVADGYKGRIHSHMASWDRSMKGRRIFEALLKEFEQM